MKIRIVKNKLTEVDKFDKIADTRPPPDGKTAAALVKWVKSRPLYAAQLAFEVVGLFPLVGLPGDIIASGIAFHRHYNKGVEEAWMEGILNLAAAIPAVGLGVKIIQKAYKAGGKKAATQAARLLLQRSYGWGDEVATVITTTRAQAQEFSRRQVIPAMEKTWVALRAEMVNLGLSGKFINWVQWHFIKFDLFFQGTITAVLFGHRVVQQSVPDPVEVPTEDQIRSELAL